MAMDLLYITTLPIGIRFEVDAVVRKYAALLRCNPNHLMQVMKAESRLNPAARNTKFPFKKNGVLDGYATGLIQFTPATARSLGTTTWLLEKMSFVEQMAYVYKYLKPYTGKLNSYFDVYLVVFFPVAVGHTNNDAYVFETKNLKRASIARSNPAIDINKDGTITMAEFKQYLKNTVDKSLWKFVFDSVVQTVKTNSGGIALVFFLWGLESFTSIVSL